MAPHAGAQVPGTGGPTGPRSQPATVGTAANQSHPDGEYAQTAPAITSASSSTFTVGTAGSPRLRRQECWRHRWRGGALPSGVTFKKQRECGTRRGTPASGQGIIAHNHGSNGGHSQPEFHGSSSGRELPLASYRSTTRLCQMHSRSPLPIVNCRRLET
jgi:hypothetical protein